MRHFKTIREFRKLRVGSLDWRDSADGRVANARFHQEGVVGLKVVLFLPFVVVYALRMAVDLVRAAVAHAGGAPRVILWRGGALRIDLPGVAVPPPVTVTAASIAETGKEPVQVLGPTRDGRYPLRRILDTVTVRGHAELTITIAAAPVTIATVSGPSQVNDSWAMG